MLREGFVSIAITNPVLFINHGGLSCLESVNNYRVLMEMFADPASRGVT